MRKIEDYLKHAAECRQMANNAASNEHRQMLLHMVETWEGLAKDRLNSWRASSGCRCSSPIEQDTP